LRTKSEVSVAIIIIASEVGHFFETEHAVSHRFTTGAWTTLLKVMSIAMSWVAIGRSMFRAVVILVEPFSLLHTLVIVMRLVWESEYSWLINSANQPIGI
jgi:hypothetical protein